MIRSNYHIHSRFCDGSNSLEEMVLAGIQAGMEVLGFTSHNPIPGQAHWTLDETQVTEYFDEIARLQQVYGHQIRLYSGMEIDYFYDQGFNPLGMKHVERMDYWIGSVHGLNKWENGKYWYVDEGEEGFHLGMQHFYRGNAKKAVQRYYEVQMEMVEAEESVLIGHMDLVKKNNRGNRYFDEREAWYKDVVEAFLQTVKKADGMIEINTGGVRRYGVDCFYPSPWILERIRGLDIRWTLNGDSHDAGGIDFYYRETEKLLAELAMNEYWTLDQGKWVRKKF